MCITGLCLHVECHSSWCRCCRRHPLLVRSTSVSALTHYLKCRMHLYNWSVFACRVSQFLVSLLPPSSSASEKYVSVGADASSEMLRASPVSSGSSSNNGDLFDVSGLPVVFRIRLRNVLLHVILRLITSPQSASSSPHGGPTVNAQSVLCCIVTVALI